MKSPLKQFSNTDEHLKLLKARGMFIENEDKAKRYLNNVGYFRLSAYWHNKRIIKLDDKKQPVLKNGDLVRHDEFIDGTSFEEILSLYIFDRQLRIVMLDAIQRAEISFRAQIVKTVGEMDRQAHKKIVIGCYKSNFIKAKNADEESGWDVWQERHDSLLNQALRERFISHEIEKYGTLENIPIWVAAEVWDFGCTQHLYSGLHPIPARKISRYYDIDDNDILVTWMKTFNFVRNICAHHKRLWNRRITKQPKLIKPADSDFLSHLWLEDGQPMNNKVYAVLCILQYLMGFISPRSQWSLKVHNLIADFGDFDNHRSAMGFPDDWNKMDLWN